MARWDTSNPNRYRGVDRALAQQIRKRDHHECVRCGSPGHEVDHVLPVSRGGTDHPDNLQVLCTPCHAHKTDLARQAARQLRSGKRPQPRHPSEG